MKRARIWTHCKACRAPIRQGETANDMGECADCSQARMAELARRRREALALEAARREDRQA